MWFLEGVRLLRQATDSEVNLLGGMHGVLIARAERNGLRDRFVSARERLTATGLTIPQSMSEFQIPLDWPRKAVEVFASRQIPLGYSLRSQSSLLDDIAAVAEDSNLDFVERQAIESADMLGCSFVFTSRGDTSVGEPEIIVSARSAMGATAMVDARTRRVTAAMELLGGARVNLYLPYRVLTCVRSSAGWRVEDEWETGTARVLCAPYVHGATLERPLGRSRVTRTVMAASYAATRTLLRQEVSAEFYSAPRGLILGADSSVFDASSAWSAVTGSVWGLPDVTLDDDMDMPDQLRRADYQQIPQMSMQPFSDQYRLQASVMSGASSIPLHYLGVMQDSNPTSAAALQAIENDLVKAVRGQEPSFNIGRRMLALNILTALYGDLDEDRYAELRGLRPRWEDPRYVDTISQSQFVASQVAAGNLQPGTRATVSLLPVSPDDVDTIVQENERAAGGSVVERLLSENALAAVPDGAGEPAESDVDVLTKRVTALGTLIRAGVKPDSAARTAGLSGMEFYPGQPVTIRDPANEGA